MRVSRLLIAGAMALTLAARCGDGPTVIWSDGYEWELRCTAVKKALLGEDVAVTSNFLQTDPVGRAIVGVPLREAIAVRFRWRHCPGPTGRHWLALSRGLSDDRIVELTDYTEPRSAAVGPDGTQPGVSG
ncbi:MAG: hypothetical protein HY658_02670 [Actinobacteria bacterium]|nr:hypothetical protein [Actinomycetota bacterium]